MLPRVLFLWKSAMTTKTVTETILVQCVDCGAEGKSTAAKSGGARTPKRWRKVAAGFRCQKCQAAQYMGRSIRLRITGPADGEDRTTAQMYQALNAASSASNCFANWLLQQLLAADQLQLAAVSGEKTKDGKLKIPPLPKLETWYRQATTLFPECAPTSLCQQKQMIERYYGKERFAALVAMNKNVRSYRWDALPVVVHVQSWKLLRIDGDKIVLRAQIGPGKSWTLNVFATGENLLRMRQLADGEVIPGTAMFVRRAREPRPGEAKRVRVWYMRISAQVPRPTKRLARRVTEKTMSLVYDADALLFGSIEGDDDPFEYPAVELRKFVVKFDRLNRARAIDNSYIRQHWSKRKAKRWASDRTAACHKRANQVKAQIELCAATLVRVCESRDVTAVDFDATRRGWLPSFPYAALEQRITTSLENAGIALHVFNTSKQEAFAKPGSETEVVA